MRICLASTLLSEEHLQPQFQRYQCRNTPSRNRAVGIMNASLHFFQRLSDGISIHITKLNGQTIGCEIALDLMIFVSCARVAELRKVCFPPAQANSFGKDPSHRFTEKAFRNTLPVHNFPRNSHYERD